MAIVLAVLAVYLIINYLQSQTIQVQEVNVVVAATNIRRGDRMLGEFFRTRRIDRRAWNENMIRSGEESQYINYFAAIDFRKDDILLRPALVYENKKKEPLAPRIPPGMRAVSVPVTRIGSVTSMVDPGDRVDILIYMEVPKIIEQTANISNVGMVPMEQERTEKVLLYILQDMTVLAVDQQVAQEVVSTVIQDEADAYDAITLTCTPEEAPILAFAVLSTTTTTPFWLLLRNPADQERLDRPQITKYETILELSKLDELLKKRAALPRVTILEGGEARRN
jgi:pilus assembly protein CpaB